MNYEWRRVSARGQRGVGNAEVYNTTANGHRISAVISFLPQITGRSNQRQVNVCLFFEGRKVDLTDGLFHWIYDDIGDIVQERESEYFDIDSEELEYMITQTLTVDRMPQLDLVSNGDYAIDRALISIRS